MIYTYLASSERENETERERQKQTETGRDRQRQAETQTETDRHTDQDLTQSIIRAHSNSAFRLNKQQTKPCASGW